MTTKKSIYEESFKIRASEVDNNHQATLPAICDLLQEIAGNHARKLSFDITDLQQDKRTWVLHRLQIQINRFPEWRESIRIKTWPSGGDGLRAHRDFLLLDDNENIIGRALSYWLILDLKSRLPVRIPKKILELVPRDSEHLLSPTEAEFETFEEVESNHTYNIRKTDLDLNNHLNNVKYIEWMCACLPKETRINNLDVIFKAEAMLGDTVEALYQLKKDQHQFQIRKTNGKILALAHS
ncbi:acyl-[acyl-carrier-protein] thioesterase [Fodinibius halophilus]|uniref:Acyl-[acyl-carrier-protein] thioesterase n=1 Tax=Fodinibius halophilus TaxID=1736908 RepID=A0A6M1STG2_9BACT|nr:acyl-ACP thioesterase domain-containing protein [Fodinibius halophilus]NGP86836.1 acyl-[acyl-carrier-protein] thioesterase [Fodinibius halophilus]